MRDNPGSAGRLFAWRSADTLAAFDAFVVLGALGLYLKLALLAPQWGAVARFLGRQPGEPLPIWDRLGFFGDDLMLNLIVVPCVGTALAMVLFRAGRAAGACAVSILLSCAYFVELRANTEVGQYISGEMLHDFVGWSLANPTMAPDYVTRASVVKLGTLIAVLCSLALAARRLRRGAVGPWRTAAYVWLALPAMAALIAVVTLAPIAYARRLPQSPLNVSAVARAAAALSSIPDASRPSPWRSLEDALGELRRVTRSAAFDRSHGYVGRESGSDLLVVVMETGPTQAFDLAARAPELPGARRLYPHAFVSSQHYTAHPYSSDAIYSILAGTYPHGRRQLLAGLDTREVNGLLSSLPRDINRRAVYLPSLFQTELDAQMYAAFGARSLYVSDGRTDDPLARYADVRAEATLRQFETAGPMPGGMRARLHAKLAADLQALERLKADIRTSIAEGGHYGALFLPEIGHGPWPALRPGDVDVMARGRTLMELQDGWLNELLDVIAEGGRLDRTVIVVTADHGLRTRAEYPALRVGFLGDVMFRVPLLVYAPHTLTAPVRLAAPTSHIDLAPTLLALLGAPDAAAHMHGVPLWQRTPRDRLYLLGAAYGGADGFLENGRFYMQQTLSGAVYASDRFAFGDADQVAPAHPTTRYVQDALTDVTEGQHALTARAREYPEPTARQ
jgi:hypothetical protein